jgi:hypothetical protein
MVDMNRKTYSRTIEVEQEFDLVIIGAGPAGAAAAVAAGRNGLSVLLLEAGSQAGGMGTAGMVSSFAPMSDGIRPIAGGLALYLVEELYRRKATGPQVTPEYWQRALQRWVPYKPEELALIWDELLKEANVTVRYCSRVVDVAMIDGSRLEYVVVADVTGLYGVTAKYFIDATGDAQVTYLAGFPTLRAGKDTEQIMPPTLCALFSDIKWDEMAISPSGNQPFRQQELLEQALQKHHFSHNDKHLPGLYRIGKAIGMMNAGHLFKTDALDRNSLSDAYSKGRRLIREYLAFYKEYFPGCAEMELLSTAALMGVRESRRIVGEYVLDYEDYQAKRRFDDGIGLCSGSVDIHIYDDSEDEYRRYYEEFNSRDRMQIGESLGIPYRALIPAGASNLIAAGRCISTDVKVQGAVRIQPAATVMGEASGEAVAMARRNGGTLGSINASELRDVLTRKGAVLD